MKILKTIGFYLLSFSWGIITTLIGGVGAIFFLIRGVKPKRYKSSLYFEVGSSSWGGVSFGPFIFVDTDTSLSIVYHEWGHGIQNIIFGPFFLLVIGIPSFCRYHYRDWIISDKCPKKWRKTYRDLPPYDSAWFEGWATSLGKKYYKKGDCPCLEK